ncbi:histone acetyltransferase [Vibrio galatheae]|uniref:Histone acetyltransferase n=1 Tax=Vibrio galatheae TaxID=579748 RepID=A0A0F4NJU2_9VIBR|nr:GNAT family N-acetyltransferase [Vibrio galatheae]KJY83425.1 histone acetyltransferase [Vibrio galatheae]
MSHMIIRSATARDLEQLNELMFALHDEHHQQCPNYFKTAEEIEQEKSIARYLDDPECLVFVACQQDSLIGFVTGHFCELISTVSKPVQMGSIDELYIFEDRRGEGIALKLCQQIEERFIEYGVKEVFVEVWEFNQSALAFYKQFGFEHHIHWLRKSVK